jgi:hypothetical protein
MKFKSFLLFLMIICSVSMVYGAEYVCDFNGDDTANDTDLIVLLAYIQTKGLAELDIATLDIATVQASARSLLGDQTLVVSRLPDSNDDLENSVPGDIGDNDLIIFLAYLQTKGLAELDIVTLDFSSVEDSASGLLGKAVGLGKFPGTPIGDSSFTTTITDIDPD